MQPFRIVALLTALSAAPVLAQDRVPSWRYVVPTAGAPHENPQPVAMALRAEPPEGLEIDIEPRSERPRYAELRLGDADSTRVALLLDRVSRSEVELYLDADRDRVIAAGDRLPREGRRWRARLAVQTRLAGERGPIERELRFELGLTGAVLSRAVLGYLEGEVELDGQRYRARRMDGDANGFLSDPRDSLWIDRDRDGSWDPLREHFLFAPIVRIDERRVALRSDRLGSVLSIAPIEGLGHIRLDIAESGPGGTRRTVRALRALLVGVDGGAATARAAGEELEVPVGAYRLDMLSLRLADPSGGPDWGYVFSEPGRSQGLTWHRVEKDAQVVLDAAGQVSVDSSVVGGGKSCRPGDRLSVTPRLLTGDGLDINLIYRGAVESRYGGAEAALRLLTPTGELLDQATSGFG